MKIIKQSFQKILLSPRKKKAFEFDGSLATSHDEQRKHEDFFSAVKKKLDFLIFHASNESDCEVHKVHKINYDI